MNYLIIYTNQFMVSRNIWNVDMKVPIDWAKTIWSVLHEYIVRDVFCHTPYSLFMNYVGLFMMLD